VKLGIHPDMVGHRIGEFVPTRRVIRHHRKLRLKALEKRQKLEAKKRGKSGGAKSSRVVDTAAIAAMRQKRKSRKLWFPDHSTVFSTCSSPPTSLTVTRWWYQPPLLLASALPFYGSGDW